MKLFVFNINILRVGSKVGGGWLGMENGTPECSVGLCFEGPALPCAEGESMKTPAIAASWHTTQSVKSQAGNMDISIAPDMYASIRGLSGGVTRPRS